MKTYRDPGAGRYFVLGACALALAFFPAQRGLAFKPTAEFGHVGVVRDAITPITRTATSGETLRFSERAINEIRDATAGVDEIFSDRGELSVPNAHCDDELLPACSQRIITIKDTVIANLASESRDGAAARAEVGRALHTLQDFYAHSNWVNSPGPSNSGANSALGRSVLSALPLASATCVDDFFDSDLTGAGLTSITTGYFGSAEPPADKCAHGVLPGAGIHKDAPGRPFHVEARAAAVSSTKDLIDQILDAPGVAGNDEAIRAFMDVRGTLGFVVDDTGSMGTDIAGVRSSVQQIVGAVAGSDNAPDNYLLVRFGDPDVGAPFKTPDASALLSAVNALFASGGGDCPELSQAGLLSAISGASSGAKLYFYSDASAKDSSLGGNVTAAANAKKITINYVLTGSCSPVDPAYIRGAQETGGQVFFIRRSEVGSIFHLIEPSLTGDLRPMLVLNDRFTGSAKSFDVPVDPSVTRVTFSVSADTLSLVRLVRPSGVEVLPTDPDVVFTQLSTARIYTVNGPEKGNWNMSVNGSGDLSLSVLGNSPIDFADFAFVELRGREEHQGLFPLNGQPIRDVEETVRARVLGPYASVQFERVALDGTVLGPLALAQGGNVDIASDEFAGSLAPPSTPFRVYARGVDASGNPFQRAFAPTFRGQTVKVEATDGGATLQPGTTTLVEFLVTNLGAAGSFRITASDDARFVTGVDPSVVSVASGASAVVKVRMFAPAGTTREFDTLTVFARSTSDPDIGNSALIGLAVGVRDSDGDGHPDDTDACPSSNLEPTIVIDGCDSGVGNLLRADGCTLSDGIGQLVVGARNHGEFVSSVSQFTEALKRDGTISGQDKGAIQACAARASIP
jgi:hypothetical protein